MPVPLSWSFPAFNQNDWDLAAGHLAEVQKLGFQWVTLHPTYPVIDGTTPQINTADAPRPEPVIAEARRLGLRIRIEPHLDWVSVFEGKYEWRRRMFIDPLGPYADLVLQPLAALLPDELTLGSELDVSAYEFAQNWLEIFEQLRPPGIALGHKLNHDWDSAQRSIRNEANLERTTRGLEPRSWFRYGSSLRNYLEALDYIAVSFYQPEPWELEPHYVIGEFGLGSLDISKPWYFGEDLRFRTPEDLEIRRKWYLRFLKWLQVREGRAASFWTVGQFDVLGIFDAAWRDEVVVEAVRDYNYASP